MWIERAAIPLVRRRAAQRPVLVVTGARQVGKTSLVRAAFPDHAYVTLDLPSEAALADRDPATFFQRYPPPVIVDEVQYAPGLFRHLKAAVDAARERNGQFILTGSQKLQLMASVSESLAGRADLIELEGLTWAEIQAARPEMTLEEAVVRGGFPELYANPELEAEAWYRSYVATYLERDVRALHAVGSLRDFERFVRACALRTAGLLNKADLARDVGVSGPTAASWLSVLQVSNQVVLLEPWFANGTKSLVKTPKLYLVDSGLCAFLLGIRSADDLLDSPLAGALWETMVFSQIRRAQSNAGGGWSCAFWRDRTAEADFLYHRGGRFDLADAKFTSQPEVRDLQMLRRVAATLPEGAVRSLAVLCRTPREFPLAPGARALPLDTPWPPERPWT
jgi:predicted AAA+ superfamily ATPase